MTVRRGSLGDVFVDTQEEFDREVARVRQWIRDAVADGWEIKPTYEREGMNTACTLDREGWRVMSCRRPPGHGVGQFKNKRGNISISMWGPDGVSVNIEFPYNWERLQQLLTRCEFCGREGLETERVGFANRSCKECLPAARKQIETPGWTS